MVYAFIAIIELGCKLYLITIIIGQKKLLRNNCSEYYHASHNCDTWALEDLTLSDNLTIQLVSSVSQIILILFSIQLCYFIREIHTVSHTYSHSQSISFSLNHLQSSRESIIEENSSFELTYGTFHKMKQRKRSDVYLSTPL